MLVTTKIKLDLQRPSYPVVVNAVQGEQNTRQLELSLYSGSVAWMVPDNVSVAMRYCKPDKTKGYYDTMPDGSASFTVSENRVSALLAPQMLTVPGTVVAQIVLHQGTQTLATFPIHIRVEADPSAGAVTSEDYVNWAQWIQSELDAYLEQLKTNGEFLGGTFVGDVNMNGHALSGLRVPVAPDDAATKEYVDENATGAVSTVAGVAPDASGNVNLTAENIKALPVSGGIMEGPINMNGQKLTGLNAPTTDNEAATKGYVDEVKTDVNNAVKEAAPYNYAHNSDFTQFIAQAGIGGNHGNQAYAGDRWILDSGTVTGDAREDGNGYTNIKLTGTIRQIVANAPDVGTAAIEMVSGTADVSYANGEITITSNGGVIKNVRLFMGNWPSDKVPAHRPKGYGAELAACQRYFVGIMGSFFGFNGFDSNSGTIKIITPVPMRFDVIPTMTKPYLDGSVYLVFGDGNALTEGQLTVLSVTNDGIILSYVTAVSMKRQAVVLNIDNYLHLSSDL